MTQTEPVVLRNYSLDHYTPRLPGALISSQSNLNISDAPFTSVLYVHQQTCPRCLSSITASKWKSPSLPSIEGQLEAHSHSERLKQ